MSIQCSSSISNTAARPCFTRKANQCLSFITRHKEQARQQLRCEMLSKESPPQYIPEKRVIRFSHRDRVLRFIAIVLSFMLLFFITGCYPAGKEKTETQTKTTHSRIVSPENKHFLRTDEWIRMLTLVLNFPEDRPTLWASIPAAQRNEISYSDFLTYITELEKGLRAQITSFSKATDEEKESLIRRMSRTGIALEPKPEQCSFWWLHCKTEDGRTLRFVIAVTADENGIPYFSATWLNNVRAMYNYIALYIDAIHQQSAPALLSLIQQHLPLRSAAHLAAIEKRTDAILEFYRHNVILGPDSLQIRTLMPGYAVIEEHLSHVSVGMPNTRRVNFYSADGAFHAEETIENKLVKQDAMIFFNDTLLFDLNEDTPHIRHEDVLPILGVPIRLEAIEDENGIQSSFRAIWPGISVEAVGSYDPHSVSFDGIIQRIQCSYSVFRTGSRLKPGCSVDELLRRYPFAQENGYRIASAQTDVRQTLAIQIEAGFISQLSFFHEALRP